MTAPKKPKAATGEAWGILNPYGDVWTHDTFASPAEARAYVEQFWRRVKPSPDTSKFRPVRVKVRVTVAPESPRPTPRSHHEQ